MLSSRALAADNLGTRPCRQASKSLCAEFGADVCGLSFQRKVGVGAAKSGEARIDKAVAGCRKDQILHRPVSGPVERRCALTRPQRHHGLHDDTS